MKKILSILVLGLIIIICSCSSQKNIVVENTAFMDKFELEYCNLNDNGCINIEDDLYYKVTSEKEKFLISIYKDNEFCFKRELAGSFDEIQNQSQVISYKSYYCFVCSVDDYYKIYFINDNDIKNYDLNFTVNDFEIMYLYKNNDSLYLIGANKNMSNIYSLNGNIEITEKFDACLDLRCGISFFDFDNQLIIQNRNYDYYVSDNSRFEFDVTNAISKDDNGYYTVVYNQSPLSVSGWEISFKKIYLNNYEANTNSVVYVSTETLRDYKFFYKGVYYFVLCDFNYVDGTNVGYYIVRYNGTFEISNIDLSSAVNKVYLFSNRICFDIVNQDDSLKSFAFFI